MAAPGADERFDVFLSYNRSDHAAVQRVAEHLRAEHLRPWLDKWILTPGKSWQDEIVQGLWRSSTYAVMVGPAGLGDWVREEMAVAQDRAAKDREFRLFMVLLPGAPDPSDPSLAFLRTRTWVDLRNGIADPDGFQDLISAITGVARSAPAVVDGEDTLVCPYRGLASFEEDQAEFFFGREDDTAEILELLKTERLVAILGPSGSGKSSLVRAGVVRALSTGRLPGSADWTIRVFSPGARPLAVLAAQLARVFPQESMQRTLNELAADPRTLDLAVTLALADRPAEERLVLVADQFEEVFTLCGDDAERDAFVANLLHAATVPSGRVLVVVGMRADFYHRCAESPDLRSLITANQFLVGPLSPAALRRVIEEPAHRVGVDLESGLLETILDDIGDRPGTLPLLQHVLFELWQRRRGRMLTLEGYVAAGKLEGALAKRANAVYEALGPAEQQTARRILLRMVQPGEGTEDTRRRAPLDELVSHGGSEAAVTSVVEALAHERLVTSGRDETSGQRVVEITHEALIRGWPELRAWVSEHRDLLRAERRLTESVDDWLKANRDEGLLFRGPRLAEWEGRSLDDLSDQEREFIAASQHRQQHERAASRRRVRLAVAGVLAAAAAVVLVALIGLSQVAEQRDLAQSRLAVANSNSQLDVDPQRALLLALEAFKLHPAPEAEQAVRQAALRSTVRAEIDMPGPSKPAFSPDGKTILTVGADGGLRLWDWATHKPPRILRGHNGSATATFNADGRLAVSGGADGSLRVWDIAAGTATVMSAHAGGVAGEAFSPDSRFVASVGTVDPTIKIWDWRAPGSPPHAIPSPEGPLSSVAYSPDGLSLVTAGVDGTVRIWDIASGAATVVLRGHEGPVSSAAISPDGKHVVSGGGADGSVRVWDLPSGEGRVLPGNDGPALSVSFSADGNEVVAGTLAGTIRVWDRSSSSAGRELRGTEGLVNGVAFSPDGSSIASSSLDGTMRVWDWKRGGDAAVLPASDGSMLGIDWSPDGKLVVAGGVDGRVQVWDWASGTRLAALRGHEGSVTRCAFSPDGKVVVSGGFDGTVRVWDWAAGTQVAVLRGHQGTVSSTTFSPDGTLIMSTGTDGTTHIWDWRSQHEVTVLTGHGLLTTAYFSPDGKYVLGAGVDGTVRVIDWRTSVDVKVLRGHGGVVNTARWSPDGKRIVSAGFDGSIRIWDWTRGDASQVLIGHQGAANAASFSADGKLVASTGLDSTVRIWDAASGRPLVALLGHRGPIVAAQFAPVGNLVATDGLDGALRIWDCDTCGSSADALAVARSRVVRSLTPAERNSFLPATGSNAISLGTVLLGLLVAALALGAAGAYLVRRGKRKSAAVPFSGP